MVNCLLCYWGKISPLLFFYLAPARGPDIWRERSPSGESVIVFWKVDRTCKILCNVTVQKTIHFYTFINIYKHLQISKVYSQ